MTATIAGATEPVKPAPVLVPAWSIAAAHPKLLATGWHPVVTHLKFADGVEESTVGEAGMLKAAGITSVENCSPTGLS